MMVPVTYSAFMIVACLVVSLLSMARSKQVPNVVDHVHRRLKRADPERRYFRVALRSYLDNRIDTLPPPDPDYFPSYHRHQNQLPYAKSYHHPPPQRSHPPKPRHRRPEVTPSFGLDLPPDFLSQDLPSLLNKETLPRALFDKPSSRPVRPSSHLSPELTNPSDGYNSKSTPRLFSKLDLPSFSSQPQTSTEDDAGSVKGDAESEDGLDEFPALDPFFLSGIDLDNPPEEDATLGTAALAGLMGSLLPGDSLAVDPERPAISPSKMDKEAEDIMEEFLTFLNLKASGALDKCLNKKSHKADD